MSKILVLLGVLCCAYTVLATNKDVYETGRPILQLASIGGFVPPSYSINQIPEVKVWEDGTVIFTTYEQATRKVLYSRINTDEITRLSEKIQSSGFLAFNNDYVGENAPTDLPSTCIKFWSSETQNKQVCDYFNGAPEFFQYLVTYMRALKDQVKDKAQPFYPVSGYVKAYTEFAPADTKAVQAYDGPKITSTGVWIEDLQAIIKLWEAANNNQLLSDCPNHYFRVSVQVEDLSVTEPPIKPQQQPPRIIAGTSSTIVIRFVALGLSGLMFILGVALLVRIVRRRRQQQQEERDEEVPMVETPSHSASVYEQATTPQYVATQQWAGQPAYVNTTPQYMVYYMQPTQTQQ